MFGDNKLGTGRVSTQQLKFWREISAVSGPDSETYVSVN